MVQRYAYVVRLRPERQSEYLRLHAEAWPGVLERMSRHHIRNYSIFLRDGLLFSYFEYLGTDFDADMEALGAHPESKDWARLTEECQMPIDASGPINGLWTEAVEVFHLD